MAVPERPAFEDQGRRQPSSGEETLRDPARRGRLAAACESPTEQLIVRTLLDTGLRVGELCAMTVKEILWQRRQLRVGGKGGPYGKKTEVRVVPMSRLVRPLMEHHLALEKAFPVK